MLNILVILYFLPVIAGLLYLSSIDGDYRVRCSRRIYAGIDSVFDNGETEVAWNIHGHMPCLPVVLNT